MKIVKPILTIWIWFCGVFLIVANVVEMLKIINLQGNI